MGKIPNPEEVAASEKEAADKKANEEAAKLGTVNLTRQEIEQNNQPSAAEDLISKANAAAARQEEANKELAKQVDRMEALKVEQTLGGKTEAGAPAEKDENAGAKKILAGTGYENMFDPPEKKKD